MKIAWFVPSLLIATQSYAGGWEASALDTGFMYKDGNYGELSYASFDYDVKATALKAPGGTASNITEKNIVKDQNRTVFSFKTSVSDFTLGLSSFTSTAMKLNGSGSTYYSGNGTAIPSADAEISTLAFVSKYSFSENFDVLLGVNQNTLAASTATTSRGTYKISGKSGTGEIYGVAYSKPEIALRVELLAQPKAKMTTSTNYVPSPYGVGTIAAALAGGDSACTVVPAGGVNFNSTLNRPETYTLNLQTGIAENTLLIGSIHKTNWSKAQIDVPTGCSASATGSKFTDTTTTKVGVGRKLSDNWSVLASYQQETGGNKTTTSLFTVNNGYQSINLGVSYTVENITISGGYSYTDVGDISVVIPVSGTDTTFATYKNNSASALGLKVGVSF